MPHTPDEKHPAPPSLLARVIVFLIAILALMAGIILSALFFALFSVLALLGSGWLWWQRRRLRRQVRQEGGRFIEGEYEVIEKHTRRDATTDRESSRD